MFVADFDSVLLRYAAASTADYHRLLEKAPEKGDVASGLYADHLRANGLHAHADFIERAAAKTGYGVNRFEAAGGDNDLPAGQWHATVGSFGGGHSVNLFQKSLHSPNVMFGWGHVGPAEEVAEIVRQLRDEGTEPELVSDAHPNEQKRLRESLGLTDPEPAGEGAEKPDDIDDADWWKNSTALKALKYSLAEAADFHRQLAAEPTEQTHSLAFADWLEENGKPATAAFIRKTLERGREAASKKGPTDWLPENGYLHVTRDGSMLHAGLQLKSQADHPDASAFIWWQNGLSKEELQDMAAGLHSEGVDVPHYLLPKSEKHSASEEALRYSTADHSDFHRAIHSEPAEFHHHLVYADWLEEQGLPTHAAVVRHAVRHEQDRGNDARQLTTVNRYQPEEAGKFLVVVGSPTSSVPNFGLFRPSESSDREELHYFGGVGESAEVAATVRKLLAEGAHADMGVAELLARHPEQVEKHSASERAVKYGVVAEHDVHDDFKPTGIAPRVGAVLNEIAAQDSDAGLLAEGIVRTGDTSLLKILADKLDDDGHAHKDTFDWRHAERGIKIDRALRAELNSRHIAVPGWGSVDGAAAHVPLNPAHVMNNWRDGRRSQLSRKRALEAVRKSVPDASRHDLHHSILRLSLNRQIADGAALGMNPPNWFLYAHNELAKSLGTDLPNPHKYPDTRPANKRYRLAELAAKYAAFRSPVGGMVVKESPHAVSGAYVQGGQFTADLTKLQPQPAEQRPKVTISELRRRWKRLKTAS